MNCSALRRCRPGWERRNPIVTYFGCGAARWAARANPGPTGYIRTLPETPAALRNVVPYFGCWAARWGGLAGASPGPTSRIEKAWRLYKMKKQCGNVYENKEQESEVRSQEPEVRSQESGVRSQESGVRSQEPEVRSQRVGARSQESGVRSGESKGGAGAFCFLPLAFPRLIPLVLGLLFG